VAGLVADRYELLEVLGQGGDSEVVQAVDRQHDRLVALKVRRLAHDEARDALLAESRALLELEPHPALPVVRDDFFLDDRHVLVMDLVDGTNVGRIVRERGDPGLAVATVLGELPAVADALDHLHQQRPRVIHGDVRPENVIITPYGRARLVFGVAAVGSPARDAGDAYRAPELGNGGKPSPASDVFGLAATIVYTLTGRAPGPGPDIEWEGVAPELAKRLDRVLRRALDPDPVRRPPTANDLLGRIVAARDSVLPVGVVTFSLTDIEGSTGLWEAHPEVMAGVIVRHYELAAEIAEAHGGRMPRSQGEGDSTPTAFARASDAVEGALAFQQAVTDEPWPEDIELRLRTGLHTGEAHVDHGDYFGAAVSRAARLRALGGGGQVLVSQATAELVADHLPPDVSLRDLGRVQLRGFGRAEAVHQLCAPGLPDRGDSVVLAEGASEPSTRLPFPIAVPPGATRFVGRSDELSALDAPWTRAVDTSQRGVVLVGGDPGIGKSRLTAEFARDGTTVAPRCCSGGVTRRTWSPTSPSSKPSSTTSVTATRARCGPISCAAAPSSAGSSPTSRCGSPIYPSRSAPSPTPSDTSCSRRSTPSSPASPSAHRSSSCSTTCNGPIARPWRCSPTSPATPKRRHS
jgi:class 3 adenylate cyclase